MALQAIILQAEEWNAVLNRIAELEKKVELYDKQALAVEWISVQHAAKVLNRHPDTVRALCKNGELNFKQGKRKIDVNYESLKSYCEKHGVKWRD